MSNRNHYIKQIYNKEVNIVNIRYYIIKIKYLVAPEFYQARNFDWQAGFTFHHCWPIF